ncbi:hypothetical protein [Neisseria shayeganii]|uniref:Quinolinate synthetase A n=1 Tax=Neisseria shayeganii 871 TaxID=1032488 RepID=G4CJA1_9NEIS|nr:hypothetical protein [Neisseria shayeganii]EGY52195.1 quinolinate synthetase A [Neisseria shayeganii 871]
MNQRIRPVYAALLLMLAACEQAAHHTAAPDAATPGADAPGLVQARQQFVASCTEAAAGEDSGTPPETFAAVCGCTFDETAAQYRSQAAWLQALADYDSGKNGDELEANMRAAGNRCAERLLP